MWPWPEIGKSLIASVGPIVAVLTFIRTSWVPRSAADRSKNLGTSLTVLKSWCDLIEQPGCTFSSEYLSQQRDLAQKRVERDAHALYEKPGKTVTWVRGVLTWLRVVFAAGAVVLAAIGLFLTVFKMNDVVNGKGWVEQVWWGTNLAGLGMAFLGLLVDFVLRRMGLEPGSDDKEEERARRKKERTRRKKERTAGTNQHGATGTDQHASESDPEVSGDETPEPRKPA